MLSCRRGSILLALSAIFGLAPAVAGAQNNEANAQLQDAFANGQKLAAAGKHAEAVAQFERALKLAPSVFGANDVNTASIQGNLANSYNSLRKYDKAEPLYLKCLKTREARLGADSPVVAMTRSNLGDLYANRQQFDKAEAQYKSSLQIRLKALGKDHIDTADSLFKLGNLHLHRGQYAQAQPIYVEVLATWEAKLGQDAPQVALVAHNLGVTYQNLGQQAKAVPLVERSLRINEARLGGNHPTVANDLQTLGTLHYDLRQFDQSEALQTRALAIRESVLGGDHPDVADSLLCLANIHYSRMEYLRAEPLFQRALKIQEKHLGVDHPQVGLCLFNLGNLYTALGQPAKAEPIYRRSLSIREEKLGADHPDVAYTLHGLGTVYWRQAKHSEAEAAFTRAIAIREARLGKEHMLVADSLCGLASVHYSRFEYAKAQPIYARGLAIFERLFGQDHARTAPLLNNLAVISHELGRADEARQLYERSLRLDQALGVAENPRTGHTLNNLALLHAVAERWVDSAEVVDRSRRLFRRHAVRVLSALSEDEQLNFLLGVETPFFHNAQSVALAGRDDPAIAALSAGWILNGKGLAQQTLAERALLLRDIRDPAAAQLAEQLAQTRAELATLSLTPDEAGDSSARREKLDQLTRRSEELAGQVAQAVGRPAAADPWVEVDAIRQALPADAALIEFSRFQATDLAAVGTARRWLAPRYAAWIIPPAGKGEVELIDLGEAAAIDQAIATAREAINDAPANILEQGEPESERALRSKLEAVAMLVLRPLLPRIDGARHWIIGPDAALWLLPWGALPIDDKQYVIERHVVSTVTSGRNLLVATASRPAAGAPLVLADPDFDMTLAQARDETAGLVRGGRPPAVLGAVSRFLDVGQLTRLPGTAAEAAAIRPRLKEYSQSEPRVLTGRQAVEGVVKSAASPKVLVLSTHGFFLPIGEEAFSTRLVLDANRPATSAGGALQENPLLRCGLLLAGAHHFREATDPTLDNGVLTGIEIVGADLRGTELVVLSACETGLGDLQAGEGVAGLRQAFHLAGARAVAATLWQIPDRETAQLMTQFFSHLAQGGNRPDALARAQLDIIANRREKHAAAHPHYWAAFTLSGD